MNNFELFKAEKERFERKKAKEGRVDGGGRKAFPSRGSQGVRRVKVDISIQTAIIPAKSRAFLKIFDFHSHFQSNMQGKTTVNLFINKIRHYMCFSLH